MTLKMCSTCNKLIASWYFMKYCPLCNNMLGFGPSNYDKTINDKNLLGASLFGWGLAFVLASFMFTNLFIIISQHFDSSSQFIFHIVTIIVFILLFILGNIFLITGCLSFFGLLLPAKIIYELFFRKNQVKNQVDH